MKKGYRCFGGLLCLLAFLILCNSCADSSEESEQTTNVMLESKENGQVTDVIREFENEVITEKIISEFSNIKIGMTLREIISIYGEGEEVHFSGKKYPWLFHWKDSQGHDVSLIFTYNNYTMADWYKSENYDLYSHLQDLSEEEKLDNYTVSYMYIKAPYTMQFESFDSIRHFLAASQSSDEIYNEYWTTNQDSTQIPRAQAIGYAEHLQASLCPVTDAKITCIFTADRNEMMYTIRVQNVLYKFTYQFDGWPQEYDQSKYVKNVTIDSYTFAMYASPAGLAGLTNIGNASVLFEIETLDTEAVKSDLTDTIRFVKCLETDTES